MPHTEHLYPLILVSQFLRDGRPLSKPCSNNSCLLCLGRIGFFFLFGFSVLLNDAEQDLEQKLYFLDL